MNSLSSLDISDDLNIKPNFGIGGSAHVYDMNWNLSFPVLLNNKYEIRFINYKTVSEFYKKYSEQIYQNADDNRFFWTEFSEHKEKYYELLGDFFGFYKGEECVGIFVGTPIDWSTYFFRNCSILPEHQNQKLYQSFLEIALKTLENTGIHRIEGDVSPGNKRHVHILNKLGFTITGIQLSERWGSLLKFTYYLSKKHQNVFFNQFCHEKAA